MTRVYCERDRHPGGQIRYSKMLYANPENPDERPAGAMPRFVKRTCGVCERVYWSAPEGNTIFCSQSCRLRPLPILDHPSDPSAAIVQCTGGEHAVLDRNDLPKVAPFKWFVAAGYAVSTKAPHMSMHRLILGTPDDKDTDHADGDKLNNRRSNLRPATKAQNAANKSARRDSLTGFKGVSLDKRNNLFYAYIGNGGKSRHLGTFRTAEDAARVYDRAAREAYGEFARPNFPDEIEEAA